MNRSRNTLGGAPRRIFAGYGPLIALAVAFLLIVTMVPTIARERIEVAQAAGTPAADPTDRRPSSVASELAPTAARPATSRAPARTRLPGTAPAPAAAGRDAGSRPTVTAVTGPCADRTVQVVGDTYSPPCIAWTPGRDNGGATSRGVSKDAIKIGFRIPVEDIRDYQSAISQFAGTKGEKIPAPTEADVNRTVDDFITYFNRNFQFYGRKIELTQWKGKGSALNEITGAGQEAANADAIHAAKELGLFADVSAFTQPYNDALARQGVVAIGAPYLSHEWFAKHAPYSWSPFPDCTSLSRNAAEYLNKGVFGYPVDHAGDALQGKPRKVGLVAPDNPEYQQCVDSAMKLIEKAGHTATRYSYTLDLSTASDQVNNLAAKLKRDGITTVVLATDPLVPLLLTSRMSQQSYYPEWVVLGTAMTDLDVVGQLYDQSQWKHAFGLSNLGAEQPQGASYAYAAFKSVDPGHEPIFGAELLYYFFYLLAIGVEMAGPNLTPASFAAGMHAYPGGHGPAGTWGFPAGEYTPYRDAREIWWDTTGRSTYNGAPGRYVSTNQRHLPGHWPSGPAAAAPVRPQPVATKEDR